jgi:hypothetical protein
MAVRIVDIDVSKINRHVGPEVLQRLGAVNANYGHAGPIFVRLLIEAGYHKNAVELREEIQQEARKLAGENAHGAQTRAAIPFALLQKAGDLACEFELIPDSADISGAVAWGWERFCQSSDAVALQPEEEAFAKMRTWFAERWNITIKPIDIDGGINNREAVAWYDETTLYVPRERMREAAGGVLKESAIVDILEQRGLLTRREDKYRRHVRYVPRVGKVEAYALKRSEFGRTSLKHDADNFRVHEGGHVPDVD